MQLRKTLARILARRRRQPTTEERLLNGETIPLHLGPNLVITVNLFDGLAKRFTQSDTMDDQEGRHLLMAARYALTCPQPARRRGDLPATPDPDNPAVRTIPVALTHRQNEHVGDVLAAYFRLTNEE
jgi:hypothetical protein